MLTTFRVEHGFYAKLFVREYGSIIATIGASKHFKRAVLICLLIRFLELGFIIPYCYPSPSAKRQRSYPFSSRSILYLT